MKKALRFLIIVGIALVLWCAWIAWKETKQVAPQVSLSVLTGISVETILTPNQFNELPQPLGMDFDITPDGNMILLAGDVLMEMEHQGNSVTADRLNTAGPVPTSHALDGSTLLTVSGAYFGQLEASGVTLAVPLPSNGMRLAPAVHEGTVYLFGGRSDIANRAYAFHQDGSFTILVELPSPIIAITDSNLAVYVATESEIFRLSGDVATLVIRLPPEESGIVSLAALPQDEALFFATARRVYVVKGMAAITLVENSGGTIRWRGDSLYTLDMGRRLLVRFTGIEQAIGLGTR